MLPRFRAYHSRPQKNRHDDRPVPSRQTIYAVARSSQPPDYRTYSAEVTSFLSNLPHHRRLRPNKRLIMIYQTSPNVKHKFHKNPCFYKVFSALPTKVQPGASGGFYLFYTARPHYKHFVNLSPKELTDSEEEDKICSHSKHRSGRWPRSAFLIERSL